MPTRSCTKYQYIGIAGEERILKSFNYWNMRDTMKTKEIHINSSLLKTLEFEDIKFSSAFDYKLTKKDQKKAYRELNELEEDKENCLRKLRKRLERDENSIYRTDGSYLLRYLRFSKFNCDRAYNAIRKLHSLRIKYPDYFTLLPNLDTLLSSNFFTCLPYKDEEGRLILLLDFRKWNTDEISFCEMLPMITAFLDVVHVNPHSQVNGIVGIWDFQGLSLRHIAQFMRPSMLWFLASILQDCYPYRLKYCFAINCNTLMKKVYASVRYLIKNKMMNRINILGSDLTELHQQVNPAVLPKEYGGSLEESECGITDLIMDNLDYLKYERSFGSKISSKLR